MSSLNITRTVYDPAVKDFVFESGSGRAMPNVKKWINGNNPQIYWYVLRVDNLSDIQYDQWAIELYTHQALSITDAYIDDSNRRFELKKLPNDHWSDKYVFSIPKQLGIPIVSQGARRIYFKVDVNCKEGLMHSYGISGKFIVSGLGPVDIREKVFRYSCKVGEFKQIFDNNPDEASVYAESRLSNRYSSGDIRVFTNSFRLIHDLSNYCHSESVEKTKLMDKLHILRESFDQVPGIANQRINPLLDNGMLELDALIDRDKFQSRYSKLCNRLVEYLHMEVMGGNVVESAGSVKPMENKTFSLPPSTTDTFRCPVCQNVIDGSNRSLLCKVCGIRFCEMCESWYREERKRGERLLCEGCFAAERERKTKEERERKAKEEREIKAKEEREIKEREERERKGRVERERKERVERERKEKEEHERVEWENRKLNNSIGMEFVKVPTGKFEMDSPSEGGGRDGDKKLTHTVTISEGFYLGKYPVTQAQWKAVMGNNPSFFKGDDRPVENVSWHAIQEFIQKLNEMEGVNEYRLPSEYEWEYACRAGTTTQYSFGDDESDLRDYAWYSQNSGSETHSVGQKQPNSWGLFDMHGNIWEWCQDGNSSSRVRRGGGWGNNAWGCRSSCRSDSVCNGSYMILGFRILRKL